MLLCMPWYFTSSGAARDELIEDLLSRNLLVPLQCSVVVKEVPARTFSLAGPAYLLCKLLLVRG